MRTKHFLRSFGTAYLFVIAVSLFGCVHHPVKTPNQLYADTSRQVHLIKTASKNYSTALVHYKKAQQDIDLLLQKKSSSSSSSVLLTDIKYNQKKIGGLTLKQFKELESKLKTLVKAEQSPLACAMLVSKSVENEKYTVLVGMVTSLYRAKKHSAAEQLLQRVYLKANKIKTSGDQNLKAMMLIRIAGAYIKWGQRHKAERIIGEAKPIALLIEEGIWKEIVLRDIFEKYVDAGNFTQAIHDMKYFYRQKDKDLSFGYVIDIWLKAGRLQQALSMVPKISSASSRVSYYLQIAKKYAQKGKTDTAKNLRFKALELASTLKEPDQKVNALSPIAAMYAEMGDDEKHDEILLQALEIAKNIKDEEQRSFAMFVVAKDYAETGEMNQAIAIIDQMKGPLGKDFPYSIMAMTYAETGHFRKALQLTESIGEVDKAFTLNSIVEYMVKADKLDYALKIANSIKHDKFARDGAYQLIANAHIKQRSLSKALRIAKKIENKGTKAEALVEIALATETSGSSKGILVQIVQEIAPMQSKLLQWFNQ